MYGYWLDGFLTNSLTKTNSIVSKFSPNCSKETSNPLPIRDGVCSHTRQIHRPRLPQTTTSIALWQVYYKIYDDLDDLETDVKAWIASKNSNRFARKIDSLPSKWKAVIEVDGEYAPEQTSKPCMFLLTFYVSSYIIKLIKKKKIIIIIMNLPNNII